MYVTNITDLNFLNHYDNITFTNCTDNKNIIDIIITTILLTVPCGLSFLCLMNLMLYTLIRPLKKFK